MKVKRFFFLPASLFALFFAAAVVLGRLLYPIYQGSSFALWKELPFRMADLGIGLLAAVLGYALCLAAGRLAACDGRCRQAYPRRQVFFSCFFLCTAVWTLFFLTFYPGAGMNDTLTVIYYGAAVGDQHPLVYCWFLSGAVRGLGALLGSPNAGFAAVAYAQLLLQAAAVALCAAWLSGKRPKRWLLWGFIAYMALLPITAGYASTLIKDTPFAIFLLLLTPCLYELAVSQGAWLRERETFLLLLLSLGLLLCRNNSLYLLTVLFLILLLTLRHNRSRLAAILATVLAVSCLLASLSHHYPSESFGVLIEQLGAVVSQGGVISEEQSAVLSEIMPLEDWRTLFSPNSVDALKWSTNFDRNWFFENSGRFFKLWLALLPANFTLYCRSYLSLSFGCWAPVTMASTNAAQSVFFLVCNNMAERRDELLALTGLSNTPLFPAALQAPLAAFYRHFTDYPGAGVCLWLTLLLAVAALRAKKRAAALSTLPLLLNYLTVLLALSTSGAFRYFYCNVLLFPLLIVLLFLEEPHANTRLEAIHE